MEIAVHDLKKNWEKPFFWVTLALGVIIFFFCLYRLVREPERGINRSYAAPRHPDAFGDRAFTFLYPFKPLENQENLFSFYRSWNKPKQVVKQTPGSGGDKPRPQPRPEPPKPKRKFIFSGWIDAGDGHQAAFLTLTDPRSGNKLYSGAVIQGQKLGEFTVSQIESDYVVVLRESGDKIKLPIRESIEVELP